MAQKTNKKLFLIIPKGQNSNRLILNLNFHAFCLEHGIEYCNPTFENSEYYVSPCSTTPPPSINFLRRNLLGPIFSKSSFVKKYFSIAGLISLTELVKFVVFNENTVRKNNECEKVLLNAFKKSDIVFTGGWCFRVPKLVEKYRDDMIMKYSLKPQFYENNDFYQKIIKLKREENVLTGIHIRRGDYKNWLGGKYYFDDDVYEKYMRNFSRELSKKNTKNQIFIIFSNDNVKFTESKNLFVSKEKWYIDHHIMSLCDYLIGPRSTFTLWANFIGKNTLFCIRDDSGNIENIGCNFYENDLAHVLGEDEAKKILEKSQGVVFGNTI